MKPVVLFYEDRRGSRKEFGFHDLVCAICIEQESLSRTLFDVRKNLIHGLPLKGNAKVRQRCQKDLQRLADANQHVIAVYDEDKAAKLVGLSSDSCRRPICDALARDCEPADFLDIVLVRYNVETVLEEIRDSGLAGTKIGDATFDRAIQDKKLLERDIIFTTCAHHPSIDRRKLLEKVPSVEHLVNKVILRLNRS